MTQKHNFIFKTVTCLIMASAIFVLTSFVLPDTNVVEAKQLSCISYESPAPATDAEAKESNIEKAGKTAGGERECRCEHSRYSVHRRGFRLIGSSYHC